MKFPIVEPGKNPTLVFFFFLIISSKLDFMKSAQIAVTLSLGFCFANFFAFLSKNFLLISIGMYSEGFLIALINLFIFLFEPLPNSTIIDFSGKYLLIRFFCFSSISSSILVG